MTIAISIDSIVDGLYARSALRNAGGTATRPPLLNRTHAPALRRTARDGFVHAAIKLATVIESVDFGGEGDIMSLDVPLADSAPNGIGGLLRAHLESAVGAYVLYVVYADAKLSESESWLALANQSIADFRAVAAHCRGDICPDRLYPAYI